MRDQAKRTEAPRTPREWAERGKAWLDEQRDAARTLESIVAQCEVWQSGESAMSAGDFLALIEDEALEALGRPKRWSE